MATNRGSGAVDEPFSNEVSENTSSSTMRHPDEDGSPHGPVVHHVAMSGHVVHVLMRGVVWCGMFSQIGSY